MENIDFKLNLIQMRIRFEHYKNTNVHLPKPPAWMDDDRLSRTYSEISDVFEFGQIHFAYLVQANSILFSSFPPLNCPANIIIGDAEYYDAQPLTLGNMARKIFSFKNTNNAPDELKEFADAITNEMDRVFHLKLPDSLTSGQTAYFTTLMVFRKHLPKRKLVGSLLPVITCPTRYQSTFILPKWFWTDEFRNHFIGKNTKKTGIAYLG